MAESIAHVQSSQAQRPDEPSATIKPASDWRSLLILFTLAGVVESQAFGHLAAFRPLFLQQLGVPLAQIPFWTGLLASLGFVIGLPLLPFWGVWADRYSRKLIIVRSAYVEGAAVRAGGAQPECVGAGGRSIARWLYLRQYRRHARHAGGCHATKAAGPGCRYRQRGLSHRLIGWPADWRLCRADVWHPTTALR